MSEEYCQTATKLMKEFVEHDIPASSETLSAVTRLHLKAGYSKTPKEKILQIILLKINACESKMKPRDRFKVDKIDVVALKELHNEIIKIN